MSRRRKIRRCYKNRNKKESNTDMGEQSVTMDNNNEEIVDHHHDPEQQCANNGDMSMESNHNTVANTDHKSISVCPRNENDNSQETTKASSFKMKHHSTHTVETWCDSSDHELRLDPEFAYQNKDFTRKSLNLSVPSIDYPVENADRSRISQLSTISEGEQLQQHQQPPSGQLGRSYSEKVRISNAFPHGTEQGLAPCDTEHDRKAMKRRKTTRMPKYTKLILVDDSGHYFLEDTWEKLIEIYDGKAESHAISKADLLMAKRFFFLELAIFLDQLSLLVLPIALLISVTVISRKYSIDWSLTDQQSNDETDLMPTIEFIPASF